ncbi:MAG: metallophosphoesterase family protein [Deltaproteobacteria bacterium]|nr:metallophosphoesterase family protein [Deltaproteobacteria bacterium]
MPPALRQTTASIAARADGTLRLAVVADTHSLPHPDAARHLAALAPDAILHGGDIGELEVLDQLAAIAPVYAVRGNIDTRARDLPDVMTIDVTSGAGASAGTRVLRILLTHIAVAGPRIRADVAKLARAAGASLVVCGHSHVPFMGVDRGLTVFNPGSIGPRRFSLPIVFGTIDLRPTGVRLAHISAETGQPWSPP